MTHFDPPTDEQIEEWAEHLPDDVPDATPEQEAWAKSLEENDGQA
jgi:hypothetical protein